MKFIHAADLHLASPFKGMVQLDEVILKRIQESTFESFYNIITLAIEKNVDFVLFAGDIYDHDDYSIKAQLKFIEGLKRLNEANILAFIVHGNHDFLSDEGTLVHLPENTFQFKGEVETKIIEKHNSKIAISGYSFDSRHVRKNIMKEFPLKRKDADYHLGLMHGNLESVDSSHANYAPFTKLDLKRLDYDYFALGHIHQQMQISADPPAYYSGNTQGRHRNEPGPKGVILVEEVNRHLETKFIETQAIEWRTLTISIEAIHSVGEVYNQVRDKLSKLLGHGPYLIDLTLNFEEEISQKLKLYLNLEDINEYLSTHFSVHEFIQVSHLRLAINQESPEKSLSQRFPKAYDKTYETLLNNSSYQELLDQLRQQVPAQWLEEYVENNRLEQLLQEMDRWISQ